MSERKNIPVLIGFVLSVSLLSTALATFLLANYYNHAHRIALGQISFQPFIQSHCIPPK